MPLVIRKIARQTPAWQFYLLVLVGLRAANGVLGAGETYADQGHAVFAKGDFSQAAMDWQKAVDLYRRERNTNAEIRASLSLSEAYQSLGQHREALQVLEGALGLAEKAGNRSLVTLAKSRLGAALTMTLEPERATTLLRPRREAMTTFHHISLIAIS